MKLRPAAAPLFVLTAALLALTGGGVAVGAIETATYGLDVADDSEDGRLHITVKAGEATSGRARVWNKSDAPLALQLQVVPARADDAGNVSLGGDGEGVAWVELEPDRVELAAGAERVVEVRVRAPRKLDAATRIVAVQVEPAASGTGTQPAVVQRLALTTYLEPDEDSLIASLGALPWVALGLLLVVVGAVVRTGRRRRLTGPSGGQLPSGR